MVLAIHQYPQREDVRKSMNREALIEKVSHLPMTPGVYLWLDDYKRIIYVGKALQLRNRVRSYLREDANTSPKVQAMMKRAVDVEIIQTETEMEALILENTLIKEHKPRYNIMLRDDKTYPYIRITLEEKYPRIFMTRRMERKGSKYYGPFTDVGSLHEAMTAMHMLYPLRTCRSMRVTRPCLQYHMKRCEAPCFGYVNEETYGAYITDCIRFLDGKDSMLLGMAKKQMEEASERLDFEEAARWRDRWQSLSKLQEKQKVVMEKGDMDVVGMATDEGLSSLQVFFVRGGRLLGREHFFIESDGDTEEEILASFLKQYYEGSSFLPKEIIVPLKIAEEALLSEWLSARKGSQVHLVVPMRGHKRDLLSMAKDNATTFLKDRHREWQHQVNKTSGAVQKLAKALDLPRLPHRMECFDISHIQGSETVASMVVFEGGYPAKKEYRRFKLKTVQGKPDDFKSMAEIMTRRYGKEKDWPMPDLIIIDGGKGQLHAALSMIREAGAVDAPVISLAKRLEEVFVEGESESIQLDHHSPELQLLQQIRDEAHRFAISYHRKLRGKRQRDSILDHIPGIGPKRKAALWKAFKTLEGIKTASMEALMQVDGMNASSAEKVYHFFRMSKVEKQDIMK